MPYGHAARRRPAQQTWRVGEVVKVGFLTLTITGKTARGWSLVNKDGSKHFEFEPHCGLYAVAAPASSGLNSDLSATRTEVVDLPKLGRQVMVFDAQRNLLSVNGRAVQGGAQ